MFGLRPSASLRRIFFCTTITASLSLVFVNLMLRSPSLPTECDAECHRFRQLLHSWPADKPKAAVILLLQPSTVDTFARSSRLFSANFNNAYSYPVIIFHEESMNSDRQRLRSLSNSSLFFQVWWSLKCLSAAPLRQIIPKFSSYIQLRITGWTNCSSPVFTATHQS